MVPPKPGSGLDRTFKQQSALPLQTSGSSSDDAESLHPFWQGSHPKSSREEDMVRKKKWRIGTEQMTALRTTVQKYEATHNFHNFTIGREFKDRSNQRFMKKIEVSCYFAFSKHNPLTVLNRSQTLLFMARRNGSASCSTVRASCCIRQVPFGTRIFSTH